MKCVVGILFLAVCATQLISNSAWPIKTGGMVFYQPDYYNAHRAFVMQYASQPVKSYKRRQGQAAGVYASGKKINAGTFVGQSAYEQNDNEYEYRDSINREQQPEDQYVVSHAQAGHPEDYEPPHAEDEEEQPRPIAPSPTPAIANDFVEEEEEEKPVKNIPQADEEDDGEEEEERVPAKKSSRGSNGGITYFPVSFGSTNGGAIAIANSYSTGKGGTASSRATAYGSPAKSKSKARAE